MKKITYLITAAIFFSQVPALQSQAAIAGAACTKIGSIKKTTKDKYVCTKVGKKRVWVKAPAKAAAPAPTPTPSKPPNYFSADKATVGTDCQLIGEFAATLEGPVSCDKVWGLIPREKDSVASRAYRYVLDEYLSRRDGNLSIIWRIDPTTPDWKDKMQTGMKAGARLWGTSPAGSPERFVFISHDPDWLYEQFKKDGLISSESRRATMFQGPCNAGLTGAETNNVSFWFYKFSQASCLTNVGFFQVPAHEYTHYAQEVLSNNGWSRTERVPWLDEGLASFIGGALGPMSDMRNDLRNMWAKDLRGVVKDVTFFSRGINEVFQDARWGDVYPVGAIAVEGMVAAIGFEKTRQIYIELSTPNTTYEQALVKTTGVTVAGWNTILQGYVDSVKAANPWSLDYLIAEYAKKKS